MLGLLQYWTTAAAMADPYTSTHLMVAVRSAPDCAKADVSKPAKCSNKYSCKRHTGSLLCSVHLCSCSGSCSGIPASMRRWATTSVQTVQHYKTLLNPALHPKCRALPFYDCTHAPITAPNLSPFLSLHPQAAMHCNSKLSRSCPHMPYAAGLERPQTAFLTSSWCSTV